MIFTIAFIPDSSGRMPESICLMFLDPGMRRDDERELIRGSLRSLVVFSLIFRWGDIDCPRNVFHLICFG